VPLTVSDRDVLWIEPYPTSPVAVAGRADPADVVSARSGLRLALIASLQYLPPRQRAVFILREALGYSAREIGEMLDMTPVAVKSILQRARATFDDVRPAVDRLAEPSSPAARAVLERYMDAFQRADVEAMNELLRADATLELVPSPTWFAGKRTCVAHLAARALTAAGLYRMFPVVANDQPAAVAYRRSSTTEEFEPFGLVVLEVVDDLIASIIGFVDPALVGRFGFPESPDDVTT
jgi:RNA polymerase sigma-70 factor (ECF subfamily)